MNCLKVFRGGENSLFPTCFVHDISICESLFTKNQKSNNFIPSTSSHLKRKVKKKQ